MMMKKQKKKKKEEEESTHISIILSKNKSVKFATPFAAFARMLLSNKLP